MKMARREAPSRLRVPPAQGLCLSKTGPPRRWLSSSRSVIRAGFGRRPPLWKERHAKMQFSCVFVVWRIEKAHPPFYKVQRSVIILSRTIKEVSYGTKNYRP